MGISFRKIAPAWVLCSVAALGILRAQGLEAFDAAVAGAWIHAQAGLIAADQAENTASIIAGDLLKSLPQVISNIQPI